MEGRKKRERKRREKNGGKRNGGKGTGRRRTLTKSKKLLPIALFVLTKSELEQ